jgi:hypothetical protein
VIIGSPANDRSLTKAVLVCHYFDEIFCGLVTFPAFLSSQLYRRAQSHRRWWDSVDDDFNHDLIRAGCPAV